MQSLDVVFNLYRRAGEVDYIGEPVSQLEHMQQAAYLAQQAGADEALILGAFFHDIGHLCAPSDAPQMERLGVVDHEGIGADYLRQHGLGGELADLVLLHVEAKRYLCQARPEYAQQLSSASKGTLEFQGGPMTKVEADAFKQHPLFRKILQLRAWDEAAKVPGAPGLDLPSLQAMAERYRSHRGNF